MVDPNVDDRLRFETLLADLSTAQVTCSAADLHAQPLHWLERIVDTLGIDRATFFELDVDSGRIAIPYAVARPGCAVLAMPAPDLARFPWYREKLLRGEKVVLIGLPDSLPETATAEREYCQRHGLKAHLAVPYRVNGMLLGGLCVTSFSDSAVWDHELQRRIELLSQVFANALYRSRAHRELAAKEARLQLAMDAAAVGIWEWNFQSEQLIWSEQAAEIVGVRGLSLAGPPERLQKLVHPEDYPALLQVVLDCIAGRSAAYRVEHRIVRPDGSTGWVECHGKVLRDEGGAPLRLIGTVSDISERKRAEAASRASHQMYESLINSIDGIVWEVDVPTFCFTYVSPQAETILGYPLPDWLADPDFWAKHLHPEDRHWVMDFCQRATAQLKDHEFQYRMVAADGRVVWLHDVVTVVVEDGRPAKLRGIMVDVTARKQVEEALRESERNFRVIFEEASIGLAQVDASFRMSRVNRALCEMLGYSAEELQGSTFRAITYADDVELNAHRVEQVLAGEISSYQME
jgi:PAS domain S-box-containing protein